VRAAVAVLLATLLLPLTAGVAAAHGGDTGPPATELAVLRAIEPAVPGLTVTVIEGGARLRLDNTTAATVDVQPPAGAPRSTEPVVPAGASAAWADPRLAGSPWTIPLLVGGQPVTLRGELARPPDPPAPPWWALTVAAALGTFSLGGATALRQAEPCSRRRRLLEAGVAAVTLAVITAHVLHVLGAALVLAEPLSWGTLVGAAGIGLPCWALGLGGVALTLARRPLGLATCATAGGVTALLTAFDTVGFHRAVLAYGWSFDLDRATTAIAFGGGVGLVLTGWAALRSSPPPGPPGHPDGPEQQQRQRTDDEQDRHVAEHQPAEEPDQAEHQQRGGERARVARGP
jgi:hypothetical protein